METLQNRLLDRLEKIEKELDKCRAREYNLPWQSQRRANMSRRWDHWAKEKMKVVFKLEEIRTEKSPGGYIGEALNSK